MTKKELATILQGRLSISAVDATDAVRLLCDAMASSLARRENIYLRGFGTFRIESRKAKPARLIAAGQPIMLPEHMVIKFKACEALKKAVR